MKKEFTMVIEQDEDGIYVASVPELEGCHTQAKTLDELRERIKEAIEALFGSGIRPYSRNAFEFCWHPESRGCRLNG